MYILALLNSSYIVKIYRELVREKGRIFPQVKLSKVNQLPIRCIAFTGSTDQRSILVNEAKILHKNFVNAPDSINNLLDFIGTCLKAEPEQSDVVHDFLALLAEQMIVMNKEKQKLIPDFLNWLEEEIIQGSTEDLKNKTKIKEFYVNSFDTFVDVLKQNRILPKTIGFGDDRHMKLEKAFNETMTKLKPLIERISKTDNLIDQIVYKLYGLTDEEIKTAEQSLKRK
jgi:RNAse (barnase) inhibitor barstar